MKMQIYESHTRVAFPDSHTGDGSRRANRSRRPIFRSGVVTRIMTHYNPYAREIQVANAPDAPDSGEYCEYYAVSKCFAAFPIS